MPDLYFFIVLGTKMAIAGLFVISATIAAERAGPFIGALIVTLPVSAGPSYVFLALDHDAAFIAESAMASLVNNISTLLYALVFLIISQRFNTLVSVALSGSCWIALTLILQQFAWTVPAVTAANIAVFLICYFLARGYAEAPMPRMQLYASDVLWRAVFVAVLVAFVVGLSFTIGPSATGVLAVFPIVYTSVMVILRRRVGAAASAAVLAHGFPGLLGFGAALLLLHVAAVPLGKTAGLLLALAASFAWNLTLFAARRIAAA